MSLSEGAFEPWSGFQASQLGAKLPAAALTLTLPDEETTLLLSRMPGSMVSLDGNCNRIAWRVFTRLDIYEEQEEENAAMSGIWLMFVCVLVKI